MYGITGLTPVGRDWWVLKYDTLKVYGHYLKGVPGVSMQTDTDGTPIRATVHLSHLPLLPGYTSSVARQSPPPIPQEQWEWLRPYQRDAVLFARSRHGVLIADDLGLGKTATATASADPPCMVLCPASAILVWEEECQRIGWSYFTFKAGVDRLEARERYVVDPPNCWIVPYSMAPRLISDFHPEGDAPNLETLIADEGHIMARGGVKASRAFAMTSARRRILLSATPMRSRLSSLWGVLNAICPKAFGSSWDFRKRHCSALETPFGLEDGEPSNVEELAARVGSILIKRTRDEVNHAVPPLRRTVEFLEADHQAIRQAVESTQSTERIAVESAVRKEIGRQKAGIPVYRAMSDLVREGVDRMVIWFWHKDLLKETVELFKRSGITKIDAMTGDSPTAKRARLLKEWKYGDPHEPRILFATIGAGATAISLTTAQAAIFVEYDWTPLNVIQAEKRHHRFGNQCHEARAHYLTLKDTDDERMLNVILAKADEAESILGKDGQVALIETLLGGAEASKPITMERIWERI